MDKILEGLDLLKEIYSFISANYIQNHTFDKLPKFQQKKTLAEVTRQKRLEELFVIHSKVNGMVDRLYEWCMGTKLTTPKPDKLQSFIDILAQQSEILQKEWLPQETNNKRLQHSLSVKSIKVQHINHRNTFRKASTPAMQLNRRISIDEEEDMEDVEQSYHPLEPKIAKLHKALFEIIIAYIHFIKHFLSESKQPLPVTLLNEQDCRQLLEYFPQNYILENYSIESKFIQYLQD